MGALEAISHRYSRMTLLSFGDFINSHSFYLSGSDPSPASHTQLPSAYPHMDNL